MNTQSATLHTHTHAKGTGNLIENTAKQRRRKKNRHIIFPFLCCTPGALHKAS